MTITVVHLIRFDPPIVGVSLAELLAMEARIMSKLSDTLAELKTAMDGATVRVNTDLAALNDTIAGLLAQIDAGTATDADFTLLSELLDSAKALDARLAEMSRVVKAVGTKAAAAKSQAAGKK